MEGWKWFNGVLWCSTQKMRREEKGGGRKITRQKKVKKLEVHPVYSSDFLYVSHFSFFSHNYALEPACNHPSSHSLLNL